MSANAGTGPADFISGPITPSASVLPKGTCRFLLVTVAGTATIVTENDESIAAVPLVVGQNNIRAKKITAATATGIFACY